jgi:hypothetical protein
LARNDGDYCLAIEMEARLGYCLLQLLQAEMRPARSPISPSKRRTG